MDKRLAALEEAHEAHREAAVSEGEDRRSHDRVSTYRLNAIEDELTELRQKIRAKLGDESL
jgi:hypothetical protein